MAVSVDLGSMAQATNDLFRLGYGIYTDQRDYWNQKELNETMMKREDSAIQRRVADAVKAGINPYDAIGAGSGAGASAGTGFKSSGLPEGLNVGSLLDFSIAREKVKQERERTKQEKAATNIIRNQGVMSSVDKMYSMFGFYNNTGFRPSQNWEDGNFEFSYPGDEDILTYYSKSPQAKQFWASYANFMNQSDMLRKENEWYNANQILDAINSGTGSVGNIVGAFHGGASSYRDINVGSYYRNQNRDYSNQKLPAKIGF